MEKNTPVFAALDQERMQSLRALPTPCYIIDEKKLEENGQILKEVMEHTGCKILLAQKAFSNYDFYPLLSGYLSVLMEQNPEAIGGQLPDDDFYYIQKQ